MATIRHILEDKGRQVWSVCPGVKIYDAIKMMADKVGSRTRVMLDAALMAVPDESGTLVGIAAVMRQSYR